MQVSTSILMLALLLLVISISAISTDISTDGAKFPNTHLDMKRIAELFPAYDFANLNETAYLYKELTHYLTTELIYDNIGDASLYFTLQQELRRHLFDIGSTALANLFNGNVFPVVKETEDYCLSIIQMHDFSMAVAIYKKAIDEIYDFQPADVLAEYLRTLLRSDTKTLRALLELQLYLYWKFMNSHQVNDVYLLRAGYYFHELQRHPHYRQLKKYEYHRRLAEAILSLPTSVQSLYFGNKFCLQNKKTKQYLYIDEYKLDKDSHPALTHHIKNFKAGDSWHIHVTEIGKRGEPTKYKYSFVSSLNHLKLSYKHHCEHFLNIASGSSLSKNTDWLMELVNNDLEIKMNEYALCANTAYFKNVSHVVLLIRSKKGTEPQPSNCRWRARECPRKKHNKNNLKGRPKLGEADKHLDNRSTRTVGRYSPTQLPSNFTKSLQAAAHDKTLKTDFANNQLVTHNIENSGHSDGKLKNKAPMDSHLKDNSSSTLNDDFTPAQNITVKGKENELINSEVLANNTKPQSQDHSSQRSHNDLQKLDRVPKMDEHIMLKNGTRTNNKASTNVQKQSPMINHPKEQQRAAVNESRNTKSMLSFAEQNKKPDNTTKTSVESLAVSVGAASHNSTFKAKLGIMKNSLVIKEEEILKHNDQKIKNDFQVNLPSRPFGVQLKKSVGKRHTPKMDNTGKQTVTNMDSEESDYEDDDIK